MYRILIIEDDQTISAIMCEWLNKWNLEAVAVKDFKKVMETVSEVAPHLILLDINLPYYDGFYWCKQIRKMTHIPVIFISSRGEDADKIRAISGGGDDYIDKPFSMDMLVTKVQAALRRAYTYSDNAYSVISYDDMVLDLERSVVTCAGNDVTLTRNECTMLSLLMKASGKIVTRAKLIKSLWVDEHFVDENTLSVNINRLRKKLGEIKDGEMIITVKGKGYKLV
ncbi:MAG: response regulator transcription factor [Eubacteriales bacterium]